MKLVLDNNIFFALMNPQSTASYLFSSIKSEFLAPEFVKSELDKHKAECLFKSKLSEQEFEIRYDELKNSIKFFKSSEYEGFILQSANSLLDSKDSPYLALALLANSAIWSNDPHLRKQPLVKVYTTEELVDNLLKGEISE